MKSYYRYIPLVVVLLVLAACRFTATPAPPAPSSTSIPPVPTLTRPAPTVTQTASPQPSATPTTTATQLPTSTATFTPIPTYVFLRGKVIVEHANCRYGPGAPYLYKYGLVGGSNLEIIGRNALGTWIEIRAIGGTNPCWVKASLMEIRGDVMTVQPVHPDEVRLPQSPYYRPPRGVSARRDGDVVTVFWSPVSMRAGDDSGQVTYLVEAWVCLDGQQVFTPLGTYATAQEVPDEPGCTQSSHGRLYFVEKHGYTLPVEIPWPAAP
jgi:SH3-like domain-containing protein